MSTTRDNIIYKARDFLDRLKSGYTREKEITKRLGSIMSNTARIIGYKISYDPEFKNLERPQMKQEIKKLLISEMINQRAFEKVHNKREPLRVAEKLSQDIINEFLSKWSPEDSKFFMSALCMIHETREKGIKVL